MDLNREYIKQLFDEIEQKDKTIDDLNHKIDEIGNISLDDYVKRDVYELVEKKCMEFVEEEEKTEKTISGLKEEINELKKNDKEIKRLKDELSEKQSTIRELNKDIEKIKTTMRKPVSISNSTLNVFEEIKKGKIIKFLQPTVKNKQNTFSKNPFTFELEGKGAVFYGELIGMYEFINNCVTYYYIEKPPRILGTEIFSQLLGGNEKTLDCKVKFGKSKSKKAEAYPIIQLLKLNPSVNQSLKQFESYGKYKYIYTTNDGSRYIIKNGKREYL